MLLLPIGRWYFRWTLFVVLNLGDDDDDEVVGGGGGGDFFGGF